MRKLLRALLVALVLAGTCVGTVTLVTGCRDSGVDVDL